MSKEELIEKSVKALIKAYDYCGNNKSYEDILAQEKPFWTDCIRDVLGTIQQDYYLVRKDAVEVVSEKYNKETAQYLDILNLATEQKNLENFRYCTLSSYQTRNYNELDCDTPAPIKYDIRHLLHWCIGQINCKPVINKKDVL